MSKIAAFKVGNRGHGIQEGGLVGIYEDEKMSDHMKTVFALVRIGDKLADDLEAEGRYDDETGLPAHKCALADIAANCKDASLVTKWRGPEKQEIVDSTLSLKEVKKVDKAVPVLGPEVPDLNAVTSGTYTVGTAKDYADWAAAAADADDQDGDLIFALDVDLVSANDANFTHDLNGHKLRLTSNSAHDGDPTVGHTFRVTKLNPRSLQFSGTATGGGTVEVDSLYIYRTTNQTDPSRGPIYMDSSATHTILIHDIIADWRDTTGGGRFARISVANGTFNIWNVELHGFRPNNIEDGGEGFALFNGAAGSIIENCVVHHCRVAFNMGDRAFVARNNVAINSKMYDDVTDGDDYTSLTLASGYNNAGDLTDVQDANWGGGGSGNVVMDGGSNADSVAVAANQFESLTSTNAAYLQLKNYSVGLAWLGNLGIAPGISGNTAGIRTNARPGANGFISIGAHESTSNATGTTALNDVQGRTVDIHEFGTRFTFGKNLARLIIALPATNTKTLYFTLGQAGLLQDTDTAHADLETKYPSLVGDDRFELENGKILPDVLEVRCALGESINGVRIMKF